MRGGRCGLLVLAMVMMVALLCGQTMRGQAAVAGAGSEVGDGSALRTDTPGPHGRARVPVPTRATMLVPSAVTIPTSALAPTRALVPTPVPVPARVPAVRAEWIDKGPVVRPRGPARPVVGTTLFPQMARAAGTIFSGTVTRVARPRTTRGQTLETVAITFHVERAIRGATPGEEFSISQWIGLWSNGQRYRVGERVLLFLYAPSKLGLTSCVAAPMGRFDVDGAGRVLLTAQHLSAFRADPVLGGKSRARFSDFALAVRRASGEE